MNEVESAEAFERSYGEACSDSTRDELIIRIQQRDAAVAAKARAEALRDAYNAIESLGCLSYLDSWLKNDARNAIRALPGFPNDGEG